MHTRLLMSTSAALLGIAGVAFTFMPDEIAARAGAGGSGIARLLQLMGALYFALAILNWMARGNLLGGIYSRPIVLGNFFYFAVAAITLMKEAGQMPAPVLVVLIVHGALAVWFGQVLFSRSPTPAGASTVERR